MTHADDEIGRIAALNDPLRRALYRHVSERGDEVSRDQAAEALGISRALAAFHLDRLVASGLLLASFRRPSGRGGPGAGRPSKFYRRAEGEVEVTIPPRRYELAARLLVLALERADSPEAEAALAETARQFGELLGAETRQGVGDAIDRDTLLAAAQDTLETYGYEPCRSEDSIRLRNCPFHALAAEHPGLVCGMNLELFRGLVDGLETSDLVPELTPTPGMCCVTLHMPGKSEEEASTLSRP